ncbi:penicillin-binding protein, partial [Streptomyces sp. 15-116A]|nr:penicillin-binding protein [Streptomyces sp. 15-116A]
MDTQVDFTRTGPGPGRRRPRRAVVKALVAVAVVAALAVGGAYAAGIGPFADDGPDPEA